MSSELPIPRQDQQAGREATGPDDPSERSGDAGNTADGASVVSWGDRPRTGRRAGLALSRLGRDGRLVPMVAILGAAAVFASLLSDWAIVTMPTEGVPSESPVELSIGVASLTTFGAAYLVTVLAVIGCLALVFFGSPGVRHNARILGLAATAMLIGLLAAVIGTLDEELTSGWQMYGDLEGLVINYGRGLVLACLGTGALGLALLLAGRFVRRPAAERGPVAAAGTPTGPADPVPAEENDWPWRRPRSAAAPEWDNDDDRSAPIDLTVTPTKPFTH